MLDIKFSNKTTGADLTILMFTSDDLILKEQSWDLKTNGAVSQMLLSKDLFSGDFCTSRSIAYAEDGKLKYISLLGLGKLSELSEYKTRDLGGKIASISRCLKNQSVDIVIKDFQFHSMSNSVVASLLAEGAELGSYRFDDYRTTLKDSEKPKLSLVNLICADPDLASSHYKSSEALVEGVFLARDLVSMPANDLYPESYANIIQEQFAHLGVKVTVYGEAQMKELGMGALLGVGQGSAKESKMVVMEYNGSDSNEKPLAFVGKGVTFDTGGISLKPSKNMWDMKYDMAGSAAVVGVIKTLAMRNARVNAVGVIGLVENMPGGNAQRPGDIVKTMSGKTIEVLDTDAEGRLVLSDVLWFTQENFTPKIMIDLATLTGAVVVALGHSYAGLFSNNEDLKNKLFNAGIVVDEKLWHLPLHKDYDDAMKSSIADIANISNGYGGGSCTAANFLQNFIKDGTVWAHLDIAGMAWEQSGKNITPKGAVGFGVKLLNKLVSEYES